jgi:hypothetical protein
MLLNRTRGNSDAVVLYLYFTLLLSLALPGMSYMRKSLPRILRRPGSSFVSSSRSVHTLYFARKSSGIEKHHLNAAHRMPLNVMCSIATAIDVLPNPSLEESTYYVEGEVSVDHLLSSDNTKSHIALYWVNQLKLLHRPTARALIAKLTPDNALGYASATGPARTGTLLESIIKWKEKHRDKLVLTRVGEFYECYGVDALMLINYAGLNAMAGAAKAGCPTKNVQATLDALTQAGLSVAVYEEIAGVEPKTDKNGKSIKLKSRVLSQIVSPASSTYIYDTMCLRSDDIEFRENRPAVGILRTVHGYTLCQIHLDTSLMSVSERLTEEGVRSLLATTGHIEPIYMQDCSASDMPFLNSAHAVSHTVERLSGYSERDFPEQVLRRVSRKLELPAEKVRICNRGAYIRSLSASSAGAPLMPIYTSTALQIGLIANENVPDLVPHLVPQRSSAYITRFLRKWLLNPPPAEVADHMRALCGALLQTASSAGNAVLRTDPGSSAGASSVGGVPRFTPVSVAKVVSLINAQQCNVALFREIRHNVNALQLMLRQSTVHSGDLASGGSGHDLVTPLLALTSYESGVRAEYAQLLQETAEVLEKIDYVVPPEPVTDITHTDPHGRIPPEFFADNEVNFRNKVAPTHPEVAAAYAAVRRAADHLCDTVQAQFPADYVVQYDMYNNAVVLKNELAAGRNKSRAKGTVDALKAEHFISFVDRNKKTVSKFYTTALVTKALQEYLEAATDASNRVSRVLQSLSSALQGRHLISIVQAAHWAVILESATLHTVSCRQKGWALPTMVDFPAGEGETAASSTGNGSGSGTYLTGAFHCTTLVQCCGFIVPRLFRCT